MIQQIVQNIIGWPHLIENDIGLTVSIYEYAARNVMHHLFIAFEWVHRSKCMYIP